MLARITLISLLNRLIGLKTLDCPSSQVSEGPEKLLSGRMRLFVKFQDAVNGFKTIDGRIRLACRRRFVAYGNWTKLSGKNLVTSGRAEREKLLESTRSNGRI